MATVEHISAKAEVALKTEHVHYEYGYGDVFHFGSEVPQTASSEISDTFLLHGYEFLVEDGTLKLEEERLKWRLEEVLSIHEALEGGTSFWAKPNKKNGFLLGLQLLAQYVEEILPEMDHDVFWGPSFDATATMSKEEIILLKWCGWKIDEENECWSW